MTWFGVLKDVESTIKETILRDGIQAIPEIFSGEGVTVELGNKEGRPFPELKVGDMSVIIGNRGGHIFNIGSEVEILEVDYRDNSYRVLGRDEHDDEEYTSWIFDKHKDLEPKEGREPMLISDTAIITYDILNNPFRYEVEIKGFASIKKLHLDILRIKRAIQIFDKLMEMDNKRKDKFADYEGVEVELEDNEIILTWENGSKFRFGRSWDYPFRLYGSDGQLATRSALARQDEIQNLINIITSNIQKSWVDILKITEAEKETALRTSTFKDEQIESLEKLNYYHWKDRKIFHGPSYTWAKILYDKDNKITVAKLKKDEVATEANQNVIDNLKELEEANIDITDTVLVVPPAIEILYKPAHITLNKKNTGKAIANMDRFFEILDFSINRFGNDVEITLKYDERIELGNYNFNIKLIDGESKVMMAYLSYNPITGIVKERGGTLDFNLIDGNFEALEEWKDNFIKVNERAYEMVGGVIDANPDMITWIDDSKFEVGPTPLGRIYVVDMKLFGVEEMCVKPKDHGGHYCINKHPESMDLPFGDHLASLVLMLINDDKEQTRSQIMPQGVAPTGGWIISSEFESIIEEIIDVRKEYFDARYATREFRMVGPGFAGDAERWVENFRSMLTRIDTWALADYEKELFAEQRQLSELQELIERWKAQREIARQPNVSIDLTGIVSIIENHNPESGLASENKVSA